MLAALAGCGICPDAPHREPHNTRRAARRTPHTNRLSAREDASLLNMNKIAHVEALCGAHAEVDLPGRPTKVKSPEIRRRSKCQKGGPGHLTRRKRELLERASTADNDEGMGTGPSGVDVAAKPEVSERAALPEDGAPALVKAGYSV
jgi:hypothetical protein